MSIPKMAEDLRIIQGLSDLPNSEDGLTADELKAKFDQAALAIQSYLNDTLIPALIAEQLPFDKTLAIDADTVQAAIENVQSQVKEASTGTIVNGSVTKEKLAADLLARMYGGLPWVSADTPDGADKPDTDFPIGQVWLRPGFTVVNEAGTSWSGSGCTAGKSGNDVVITGSSQVAAVTASQNLTGLGNQGDRVLILFTVQDRDSEITALTASVNGGTAQAVSGNAALEGTLSASGALSVQIAVTWPSASLADGSVTLGNYTVVNLDKIMRQISGAGEISDWTAYLRSLTPFASFRSPEAVFIQQTAGSWYQISFDVLPVSRGGTGLSSLPASKFVRTAEDGSMDFVSKAELIEDLGSLRLHAGSYAGSGKAQEIELPVEPKLLLIYTQGADKSSNAVLDGTITLGNGAAAMSKSSVSAGTNTYTYYSIVHLSGKTLTLKTDPSSVGYPSTVTPECFYGNRSGVTYNWIAIY